MKARLTDHPIDLVFVAVGCITISCTFRVKQLEELTGLIAILEHTFIVLFYS
jgi:hypothetical protein